jgi:predicted TIM-barrel enzyme
METHKIIDVVFGVKRALIGVVHTGGLPGPPASERSVDEIIERKVATLVGSGVTLENLHECDQTDALIVGSGPKTPRRTRRETHPAWWQCSANAPYRGVMTSRSSGSRAPPQRAAWRSP